MESRVASSCKRNLHTQKITRSILLEVMNTMSSNQEASDEEKQIISIEFIEKIYTK